MENTKILRHLPEFLQEGYNLTSIVNSVAEELTLAITFLDGTKSDIQISTASNEQLDDIGRLFKLNRYSGESDEIYRARILSYVNQSKSSGSKDEIVSVIASFTGLAESDITVEDLGPGKIKVTTSVGTNFDLSSTVYDIINDAKSAGIYAYADISGTLDDFIELIDTVTISVVFSERYYSQFKYGNEESKY